MQVVFHLQTRSPPILPPICQLFDLPAESIAERPLHMGHIADEIHLHGTAEGEDVGRVSAHKLNSRLIQQISVSPW